MLTKYTYPIRAKLKTPSGRITEFVIRNKAQLFKAKDELYRLNKAVVGQSYELILPEVTK